MFKRPNFVGLIVVIALLLATSATLGTAVAQMNPGSKPPKTEDLRESEVKRLLLLMDTDKNGKISKQEWMAYMGAEFDRLDTDKSGELDPKELTQSSVRPSSFTSVGK